MLNRKLLTLSLTSLFGAALLQSPVLQAEELPPAIKKIEAKGAKITTNAVAYRLETDGANRVIAVNYFDQNKGSHRITGKLFVLACNGIETPKLLLMSANARNPNGLANSSDQVGRNSCLRCRHRGVSVTPRRCYRRQASSHILICVAL